MGVDAGLERRPLTPDGAREWAKLLAEIARADGDDEVFGEAELLEDFEHPRHDFDLGSAALYDGDLMVGWTLLTLREKNSEIHQIRQEGGVHPGYRGRGLGSELIAWSEQAAIVLHEQRHPGGPLSLTGECLLTNAAAMDLYAGRGYEAVRWFHLMECDLSAGLPAELPQPPAGLTIAGFRSSRSADAHLVRNEAFRDHWESTDLSEEEWERSIGLQAFRPGYSFVGYDGDEPVAMIITQEYEAYNNTIGGRDLYISTVGTRRAARGHGVASAMVVKALGAAIADGFKSASLNVDADSPTGAVGIYERLGFKVTNTAVAQRKQLIAP